MFFHLALAQSPYSQAANKAFELYIQDMSNSKALFSWLQNTQKAAESKPESIILQKNYTVAAMKTAESKPLSKERAKEFYKAAKRLQDMAPNSKNAAVLAYAKHLSSPKDIELARALLKACREALDEDYHNPLLLRNVVVAAGKIAKMPSSTQADKEEFALIAQIAASLGKRSGKNHLAQAYAKHLLKPDDLSLAEAFLSAALAHIEAHGLGFLAHDANSKQDILFLLDSCLELAQKHPNSRIIPEVLAKARSLAQDMTSN